MSNVVHNGTEYNAVVDHYYRIGTDLSLTQVLAVERRNLIPVPMAGYKKPTLDRVLSKAGSDWMLVTVELNDAAGAHESIVVGKYTLSQESPSLPYKIDNEQIDVQKYASELVTGADEQATPPYNIDGFILKRR